MGCFLGIVFMSLSLNCSVIRLLRLRYSFVTKKMIWFNELLYIIHNIMYNSMSFMFS